MTVIYELHEEELDEEFQRNHDNWDFENAEIHEGVKNPGAVYSVRFKKDDISTIRDAAEAHGVTTSEFIRSAAIAAARGESTANLQAALAELRNAVERAEAAVEAVGSAAGERLAG